MLRRRILPAFARLPRAARVAVGLVGAAVALAVAGVMALGLRAALSALPTVPVPVSCARDAPVLRRGQPVRALVWNIQYAAGREHHFFYDGGDAVSVSGATVERTLDRIARVIARVDPDFVLLQEVDRDSRRTARIDQHAELLRRVAFPCHVSTPYFRAPYVPHPPGEHLGRMDMHLSVFSKFRLDGARRHQLALLDEPWLRRQFNLRRALLEVRVPLEEGGQLVVFDSHLSAFSHGDGTLGRQVAQLQEHFEAAEAEGTPWIFGADLNTLPPGDDPSRLAGEATLYADGSQSAPLIARYGWPVPREELATDPAPWYTYLPFGADRPDRTIDYVFHGTGVLPGAFAVLSDVTDTSDHLPLLFDFVVAPRP